VAGKTKQQLILQAVFQDGISAPMRKAGSTTKTATDKMRGGLKGAERRFKGTGVQAKKLSGIVKRLAPQMIALAGVGAGLAAFSQSARAAGEFSKALSEVSTLVDTSAVDMGRLRDGVLEVSNAFGATPVEATKGLYQTISSGAVEAGDAVEFLAQAQQLAVAGVASTAQSVDVLTTALNAYGAEASEAGEYSDILFETVRQGKTTLPELANSLGRAIPIAAALGVSLEELSAATATLTKGGLATDEAVTALRGAMSALLSPQKDAQQVIQELGVDISSTRIEADGFAEVLLDLADAVGDDQKKLRAIFPDLRGFTAALALTGKQAGDLQDVLEAVANATGATGEAVDKQLADPAKRAQIQIQNLKNAFLGMGDAVILGFSAGIKEAGGVERVAANLKTLGTTIGAVFAESAKSVGNMADKLFDIVDKLGGPEELGQIGQAVAETIGAIARFIVDSIANAISSLWTALSGVAEKVAELTKSIDDFSLFELPTFDPEQMSAFKGPRPGVPDFSDLSHEEQRVILQEKLNRLKEEEAEILGDIARAQFMASSSILKSPAAAPSAALEDIQGWIAHTEAALAEVPQSQEDFFARQSELWADLRKTMDESWDLSPERLTASAEDQLAGVEAIARTAFTNAAMAAGEGWADALNFEDFDAKDFVFIPDELVGPKLAPDLTTKAAELADALNAEMLQIGGDAREILEAEFAQLDLQVAEVSTTDFDTEQLSEVVEQYKALRLAKLEAAEAEAIKAEDAAKLREEEQAAKALGAAYDEINQYLEDTARIGPLSLDEKLGLELADLEKKRDALLELAEAHGLLAELGPAINAAFDQRVDDAEGKATPKTAFDGLKTAAQDYVDFVNDDFARTVDLVNDVASSFENNFANAFVAFAEGTMTAGEAFKSFADGVLRDIARILAKKAAEQMIGAVFDSFSAADGAVFGGGLGELTALANGGVVQNGLGAFHAYAAGGPIVREPHVALIGEGKYNEAVVPLPNGRELPVDLRTNESERSQRSGGGKGTSINVAVAPEMKFEISSLDPRTAAQMLQSPDLQASIQSGIIDTLTTGINSALSHAVREA